MFYDQVPEPLTFAFLAIDDLSLMSMASAIEPLRMANRLLRRDAFDWRLCSLEGASVSASCRLPLPTLPASRAIQGAHALFVCGGTRLMPDDERRHFALLRSALRRGLAIGSLSTASYLLARAGLLDGYRCTIHWENSAAFQEEFPLCRVTGKIYEIDRDRLTCSGGTAAMDMMFHIIADRHGRDFAARAASQFHHERIREADAPQQGGEQQRIDSLPQPLRLALRSMQRNLETPAAVAEIAAEVGLSPRQLERLFKRYLGTSPTRHYLALRIERAHELLTYTNKPILEIAIASGFASTSHFSHWFRRFHGQRPSEVRERARQRPGRR